jgi:hypothetical protein
VNLFLRRLNRGRVSMASNQPGCTTGQVVRRLGTRIILLVVKSSN